MASLCLPNSGLYVGHAWEDPSTLGHELSHPDRPAVLLYPDELARDVSSAPPPGPVTLVVVDGTWPNTRKMVKRSALLRDLPRVAFAPARPSEYRIRREPRPDCVSTVEALAHVLGALEGGPERFEHLLLPFRKMVEQQVSLIQKYKSAKTRRRPLRQSARSKAVGVLKARARDIVCVVGEANAWPYRAKSSRAEYPDEIVHWVARRLHTGETFESVAAPRNPLSPSTPHHLELLPDVLRAGKSYDALLSEWRDFVRDTDVLCSWGCFATSVFNKSGGVLTDLRFDLRRLSKQILRCNLGSMDDVPEVALGSGRAPLAAGRAGRRLGQLVRVAEWLVRA